MIIEDNITKNQYHITEKYLNFLKEQLKTDLDFEEEYMIKEHIKEFEEELKINKELIPHMIII